MLSADGNPLERDIEPEDEADGDDGSRAYLRNDPHARNTLNALSGNEWLYFTKTVLRTSYPAHVGQDLRRRHGANKPPYLMRHLVEFLTKPGGTVLDPFAGVGGTLLGASISNPAARVATGIEINPEWISVYREVCAREGIAEQEMIEGDCRAVLDRFAAEGREFDCIATDPPYSIALDKTMCDGKYDISARRTDFDSFGDSGDDLRNLQSFDAFFDAMGDVAARLLPVLRRGGYCAVIIRDSYQQGRYVFATAELAQRFERAGFVLKGVKVWYGTGSRVRPYGYPSSYVPNIVHQNILILRRPLG
ncbi:MAG TPA: DNA methyltransferase [Candidatus Angelobacter sp.]|jgi:DNA modification methylase|nr:DNA methyltransferase [Candidatus Angelobacter sp.]